MSTHRIYHPPPVLPATTVEVPGDEAHHAIRVKRLEVADPVELLDGRGHIAHARVKQTLKLPKSHAAGQWALELVIEDVLTFAPASPRIEVWAPTPKGERLDQLIDQLSQVGAAAWIPLEASRTVADPTPTKLGRLDRITTEAMKQCGRPWLLEIAAPRSFQAAIAPAPDTRVILADAQGQAAGAAAAAPPPVIRLLIGPEGGFTPEELAQARAAGVTFTSFGPHTMRIETAAVVAAAALIARGS